MALALGTTESFNVDAESLLATRRASGQGDTAGSEEFTELTTRSNDQNNPSSSPKKDSASRMLPFLTWDIVNGSGPVDTRSSIHAHYSGSRWISAVGILACLQIVIIAGFLLDRLTGGNPSVTLGLVTYVYSIGQLCSCFVAILFGGLFPRGRQISKTRMFCIMFLACAISGVFFYILTLVI